MTSNNVEPAAARLRSIEAAERLDLATSTALRALAAPVAYQDHGEQSCNRTND